MTRPTVISRPANPLAAGAPTPAMGPAAPGYIETQHRWALRAEAGKALALTEAGAAAIVQVFKPTAASVSTTPLVFLPGLIGLNEHWMLVVERVRERLPCVLFQPPLLKVGGEHASTHGWAEITSEFLRSFLDRPAILVGSSFGGHVAMRTALRAPELVRGIVLTGSSGMGEKSIISDNQVKATPDWCQRRISELYHDQSHVREDEIMRAFAELSDRSNARVMIRLSKSARRDHLTDELPNLQQPSLLIWGKQDIVTPPAACRALARGLPNARMVWLDECGHVPMVEKPGPFAEALAAFAAEIGAHEG